MALQIKLDAFEGPLDLLLHLIEKNKIDINDIPIAKLTSQYMAYLKDLDQSRLDIASDFLVIAATLLNIKSRVLLPDRPDAIENQDGDLQDEDPRERLATRLVEYKRYKEIATVLKNLEEAQKRVLKRSPTDLSFHWSVAFTLPKDITLQDLLKAYSNIIKKSRQEPSLQSIARDPIPLASKIKEIFSIIRECRENVGFRTLIDLDGTKMEFVVTLLAVLELVKMNKIIATQEESFGPIEMSYRGETDGSI